MGRRLNLWLTTPRVRVIHALASQRQTDETTEEGQQRWGAITREAEKALAFHATRPRPANRNLSIHLTTVQVRTLHAVALEQQKHALTETERQHWGGVLRKTRQAIEFDDDTRGAQSAPAPGSRLQAPGSSREDKIAR
jgi:hypothetical protein